MCFVLIAWQAHPGYPLIVAANRDEFYARPTAPAAFWEDAPNLLAGRDLKAGGTWMGVTRAGRLALVTNFRERPTPDAGVRSRGSLVTDFLLGSEDCDAYLARLTEHASDFAGFNLIFGDFNRLAYFSNRGGSSLTLSPGVHGLSNALLDTPWPKVDRGIQEMERLLIPDTPTVEALGEALFRLLSNSQTAPDADLPNTGVGLNLERALSSPFIATPTYGTRSSTVLLVDSSQRITFAEQTFHQGQPAGSPLVYRLP